MSILVWNQPGQTQPYQVSNRYISSGYCYIEELNANIPKDDSTQIRIEICRKENLKKTLNIYIYTSLHLSTSDALNVDECEIKRLTYHRNEFLPDKYISHGNREMFEGKCVEYNSSPSSSSSFKSIDEKDEKGNINDIPIKDSLDSWLFLKKV